MFDVSRAWRCSFDACGAAERRKGRGPHRRLALTTVVMVLAAGCAAEAGPTTTGASSTADAASTSVATAPPPARQDIDAGEFLEVLAAAGVSIVDAAGVTVVPARDPVGPVSLTEWQAAALAREAALGVGIPAGDLDALLGEMIPGAPSSSILAGYVLAATTPGGEWAASLLGPIDLEDATQVEYPAAVLLLFVAELARPDAGDTPQARPQANAVAAAWHPAEAGGIAPALPHQPIPVPDTGCGLFTAQVGATLSAIFVTLAAAPPVPLPPWLEGAGLQQIAMGLAVEWNAWVYGVATALAALLTVSFLVSLVGSWSMSVTPSAVSDRFSVGAEGPRAQTFTAEIAGSPMWPPGLEQCAASAGVTLPGPGITLPDPSGAGSAVTWDVSGFPQFGSEDSRDEHFDEAGRARLHWHTGHEDSDAGTATVGIVTATVLPDPAFRDSLLKTASAALTQLLEQSGLLVFGVQAVALPEASAILGAAGQLMAQHASASVEVVYHTEDCLTGTWVSVAYRAAGQETLGGVGTVTLEITAAGQGTVTFDPGNPVYSRTEGPNSVWVMMELEGSYTIAFDAAGTITYTGGEAYLTPYADLGGGWVQTSEGPLLITEGGVGSLVSSTFDCSGTTLTVSSPYSQFDFGKVG